MGEPAGIGPEVAIAAFHHFGGRIGDRALKLVGDPSVFPALSDHVIATTAKTNAVPGKLDVANSAAVTEAIEIAVRACLDGEAAALVTAPIHKAVLNEAGFAFPGHTEFLGHLTGGQRAVMMLASDMLRVVPLTIHMPLAQVPAAIDQALVVETAQIVLDGLTRDFGIAQPRLAVAGLNPHAGEDGMLGAEEERVIRPAIATLQARGHAVTGPLSADTLFHAEARAQYDAALCMYHDQALIPIKTLSFWDGVNVTLGLPILRTSPDHGTALNIAGMGKADPRSMIAAVSLAAKMADARAI